MQMFKSKIYKLFFIFLILSLVLPFCSYATDATSYVWSEISSPIVTTSSVLSEGERKFFESYLW